MSSQLLSAKVIAVEEAPTQRTITALPSAVAAFLGITERGPVNESTQVTSFEEYVQIFGSFTANSDLSLAIQGFFQNGGKNAWIVRTVHFTDITDPLTKASAAATLNLLTAAGAPSAGTVTGTGQENFDLEPGQTVVVDVDGGGDVVATFDAAAALRLAANAETYALVNLQTLTVAIDGGGVQTITFNTAEFVDIANATAAEVAAVINAEISGAFADVGAGPAPRITSDRRGTGSGVNVTGGTANAALGFVTGNLAGTGDVSDIDAVTGAEAISLIEADIAGLTVTVEGTGELTITSDTTGPASSILVNASSTALDFGFDNATHSGDSGAAGNTLQVDGKTDGTYANLITILIAVATSGGATEFNLSVIDDGLTVETFPNVTMDDLADNFVETIINNAANGSRFIAVVDLDSSASDPRPAVGTFGPLTGGDDGLSSLDDNDFVGSTAGGTGLHAFDETQGLTLLVVPGRATSAVQNAMITYGETFRDQSIFSIFDPPASLTVAQVITYFDTTAALLNSSEFGAFYYPRIKVLNPSKAVFGSEDQIVIFPSGHIAGVYARNDGARPGGVYLAPAGEERGRISGLLGFESDEVKDEAKLDLLYPKRINPITVFEGGPRHIDGSRTLKGNGNFPSIPERRGVMNIVAALKIGLRFLKHGPNTAATRAVANRTVTRFLIQQMKNGAFASTNPETAFFVDTSEELNPPSVRAAGTMIIRIGLAMAKPAEFIVVKVTPDTRALDEELAA